MVIIIHLEKKGENLMKNLCSFWEKYSKLAFNLTVSSLRILTVIFFLIKASNLCQRGGRILVILESESRFCVTL